MKSLSKRAISLILAVLMIMDVFTPVAVVASTNSPQNNVHVLDEVPESETNSQNNDILIPATPQNNPEEDTLVPAEVPGQNSSQKPAQKPAQKPVQNNKTPNQLYKSWTLVNPGKTTYAKGDILDLSQLSVRVTKEDGTVTTLSYVQLLKDTNFDIIENVGNKINLQPGKGSVTLVGPSLNPITVNIVVNDSTDKLQGTNSKDELVPAIDPQAKEENDELVVAENPNDKKTNIIEGNEQNSPEKDKQTEEKLEKEALKGNILDQVAGKETEENPLGLKAFDPLKALGLNREADRELTEEELEAGLTKVELPTLNEAPVSPVFFRSAYNGAGLLETTSFGDQLDMSDEIVPEAVGTGNSDLHLDGKKFNIITRFDTSTAVGPIKAGQFFRIHLDNQLKVNDTSTLKSITKEDGTVIATPQYNPSDNTITYTIKNDINENIQVPLNIPVDYNTGIIKLDDNGEFTVVNKVSGLGVTDPKDLIPTKVNKYGNVSNQIIEPNRKDVIQIINPDGAPYRVYTDAVANPVIKDRELVGFNWTIKITSDTDLSTLGYKANFTTVKGSGLGEITSNDTSVTLTDQLPGAFGINDSKHHAPGAGVKEITYNLYTPKTGKRSAYMMDISVILTEKGKVGAKRVIAKEAYGINKIADVTPNRVGMNNRTTILGEFTSEQSAKWTVTDAVSTGDKETSLPLEDRTLGGNQTLQQNGGKVASYGLDTDSTSKTYGQMVVKKQVATVDQIPAKGTNPGASDVGTIAVYEYTGTINNDANNPNLKKPQTLGGVAISRYQDVVVDQNWNLPDGQKMPAQTITVTDKDGNKTETAVGEGPIVTKDEGKQRTIIVPGVKYWKIDNTGKATSIDHKVSQDFPTQEVTIDGKKYKYSENANYYRPDTRMHYIQNSLEENSDKKPATFTVVKVDSKDPNKRVPGASFDLLGANVSVTTDANGEATFRNIKPGRYYLTETKAPEGYKPDQNQKTIIISDTGQITVYGENAKLSAGSGKTEIVEHSDYPNWPDFMNAMHYGKLDSQGNLEFYVYLKPFAPRQGGKTDKDTRFNISIPGVNLTNAQVKLYDLDPTYREYYTLRMKEQTMDTAIIYNDMTGTGKGNRKITGTANYKDPNTGKTGYSIFIPATRFGDDWGFLVKVKANVGSGTNPATVSYDWLANENTANNSKIQEEVNISTNPEKNGPPTITITNEKFKPSPIEVVKLANTFTEVEEDGKTVKKRDRLPGAEFILKDAKGNPITNGTTGADGKVNFGDFSPGTYYIEEQTAPAGYEKSDVYYEVIVNEKGEVTYNPKFKTSSGTPVLDQDYAIERGEETTTEAKADVLEIHQHMDVKDSGRGRFPGVWEAYELESLKYTLDAKLEIKGPGSRFEIQFDKNLDFTQYFTEFPVLYDNGKVIAKPYFDHNTNLLTYVFTENAAAGDTSINLNLFGMIPNKFYAKTHGEYEITNVVAPGKTVTDNTSNQTETIKVKAYYGEYDAQRDNNHKPKSFPPSQEYYFRDVYQDNNGDWYVKAFAYYNPYGKYAGGARNINFNWMSTDYQQDKIQHQWEARGNMPAFKLENVKVYRTDKSLTEATYYNGNKYVTEEVSAVMPLSMGIRPEQDPSTYKKVFETNIDPDNIKSASNNDVYLEYNPRQITQYSVLQDYAPLKMTMPRISGNREGYVIEQTFRIPDIKKFNKKWRAFYMGQGTELESTFITGPNKNYGNVDQTGQEIPKFYKEIAGIINKKFTPGQFKITKTEDNTGNVLEGAIFSLTDSDGNTIYRTSDANGLVNFETLKPGRYTLRETQAPKDHTGSNEKWEVTVSNDGSVRIEETSVTSQGKIYTGNNDKDNIINIPVTNRKIGESFQVFKKGEDGKPLQGATFKITKQVKEGEQPYTDEKVSDEKGVVNFKADLTDGTYIIEETQAPDGYKKLNEKWVLVIDKNEKKVYKYSKRTSDDEQSLFGEKGTYIVNVKDRPQTGWEGTDNRNTGWAGNTTNAEHLGTRIIAINKDKKYVIQRYVINPEAKQTVGLDGVTSATIHREKPNYPNMDWYNENNPNNTYKIFTLDPKQGGNTDGKVTGLISDLRLADYTVTDITSTVKKEADSKSRFGETRLRLSIPETKKPIVVDVKVPYSYENGGVGTGMDWRENGVTYWKSDYYERVSDIVLGDTFASEVGTIKGSYIGENSLDVTNQAKTYGFKLKKVKENETTTLIPGAKFQLTGPDGSTIEMTTDKDGTISFDGLKPGTYTLKETAPAPGYEQANNDWTVTITKDGKTYIKEDKEARSVSNATVTVAEGNAGTQVGSVEELKAKLYTNLSSSRLKRSLAEIVLGQDDLEIGDELIGAPVGAGGWEAVDSTNSDSPTTRNDNPEKIQTKITDINKKDGKIRQVFLINKENIKMIKARLDFHAQPKNMNVIGPGVNPKNYPINLNIISVRPVSTNSTINKLDYTGGELKYLSANYNEGIYWRNQLTLDQGNYQSPFAVVVEFEYQKSGAIGLGADYQPNRGDASKKYWAAESYTNGPAGINKNQPKITYRDGYEDTTIPMTYETKDDPNLEVGQQRVEQGQNGTKRTYYKYEQKDGVDTGNKTIDTTKGNNGEEIITPMKPQITYNGTKQPGQTGYSVSHSTPENGTLEVSPTRANAGDTITVKATPNTNYKLKSLYYRDGDGNQVDIVGNSFEMPRANVNVFAEFEPDTQPQPTEFNITTSVNDSSLGSVSVDKDKAAAGDKVTVTVTPKDSTVEITSVNVGGTNIVPQLKNGVYTFDMPAKDVNINVTFNKKEVKPVVTYYVSPTIEQGKGRVVVNPTSDMTSDPGYTKAAENEKVTFTIRTEPNWQVKEGSVYALKSDGSGQKVSDLVFDGTNGSFTMPNTAVTIYVTFETEKIPADSYVATVDPTMTGGNISISQRINKPGEKVRITLTPYEGFKNTKQSVKYAQGGTPVPVLSDEQGYYFIMPASNVTVSGIFEGAQKGAYDVNISQIQNGRVSASPTSANQDDEITLSAVANPGYVFKGYSVTANGQAVPLKGNKFKMPAAPVSVSANFEYAGKEIKDGQFAQITNKQTGLELTVFKVNSLNRRLPGAEFTIVKYKDDKYQELDDTFKQATGTSDENGVVVFKVDGKNVSLPVGHYIITETKSPSGYKKSHAPWKLEVKEEAGQLKAKYSGPADTPNGLVTSDKAKAESNKSTDLQTAANGIKYKARLIHINPESKNYVQRIYIDTRGYNGSSDKINVQITPKYKRDEIDYVPDKSGAKPPDTLKEGVKTAYRSTYKITGGVPDTEIDNVLRYYDLSKPNVSMINTARWRPFDWGFDEDLLNLEKGVYFIDIEGFYDDAIITGIDNHLKDAQDNPIDRTVKDPEKPENYIDKNDLGKLDLNIDFYDGERKFQQAKTVDGNKNITEWTDGKDVNDAYLLGNVVLGYVAKNEKGQDVPTEAGLKKANENDKYPLWLGKTGGRIYPSLENAAKTRVETRVDISTLYSSKTGRDVPQDGLTLTNEEETYNITFSKHGRDNPKDAVNSETVTNKRLEGAIFKLQEDNGLTFEDVPGSYVSSAFNGYFGFRNLKPGRYQLIEVKAPEGYKPINGPLLQFTVETIKTNSGKIVHPETGEVVDIKSIQIKFSDSDTEAHKLETLQMVDKDGKIVNIKDAKSVDINVETTKIINPHETDEAKKQVLLKDLKIVGANGNYDIKDAKIVPGSSGYISLEYNKANGVYQYVPDKSTTAAEGKLIDFVTSATAKNMGKIVNEKPGKGSVKVKKVDEKGNPLTASDFKLTRITKEGKKEVNDGIYNLTTRDYKETITATVGVGETKGTDISIDPIVAGAKEITGTTIGSSKVTITLPDTSPLEATSDTTGKFIASVPEGVTLANGNKISASINEQGVVVFDNLPIGNYELEETKSKDGYQNKGQKWYFTVGGQGLDPYAADTSSGGDDLTKKLTLTSTFKVQKTLTNDDSKVDQAGNRNIYPHRAQSIDFTNKFTVDSSVKIKPGDYFEVKLSDSIDLVGIYKNKPLSNLDIFADGIGTIAKGVYDKDKGVIKYTFTEYAKTYTLKDFKTDIVSWINLDEIRKSKKNVPVGMWLNKEAKGYEPSTSLDIDYDIKRETSNHPYYYGNYAYPHNITGKIFKMDRTTGEFTEYYYINRMQQNGYPNWTFRYDPYRWDTTETKTLDYANIRIVKLPKDDIDIDKYMPESFAVNMDDPSFKQIYNRSFDDFKGISLPFYRYYGRGSDSDDLYIVEVKGKIPAKEIGQFETAGEIIVGGYVIAARWDLARFDINTTEARANFVVHAINPKNEIIFKKVDQNGKALKGARFKLKSKLQGNKTWSEGSELGTDENGILTFNGLKPGDYELIETHAPDGHKMAKNPVVKFKVDKNGRITREVTDKDGNKSTEEITNSSIYVVNNKEQEIEFKKVDVDGNPLAGAEFEVWFKKDTSLEYNNTDLKLYQNAAGDKLVLNKDEKPPTGYDKVKNFTTGDDGILKFKLYDSGYYALKEVKAPKGYIKPKDPVKEFSYLDGKIQEEKYKTSMDVSKTVGYGMSNDVLQRAYSTSIVMKFNPDHQNITYTKDKSKLTLSGLPLGSEFWDNSFSQKQGLKIDVYSVDKTSNQEVFLKTYDLGTGYDSKKGSREINLYDLLKGDNTTATDPIESDKTIVFRMSSTLALNTELDIKSNITIGDKIKEERTFNIGTKGDEYKDHSYSFTTKGTVDLSKPIDIENKKGEYPSTGGMGTFIFTCVGASLIGLAYLSYRRRRGLVFDE